MEIRDGVLWFVDEEDAWDYLASVADGYLPPATVTNVLIENFPLEILYFPDEKRGHTITAKTAKAISDFHASFSKGYSAAMYGRPNRRLLTAEDNAALNIKFVVKDGSTGYDVVKELFWDSFVAKAAEKMSGTQITAILVLLIVSYFGHSLLKHLLDKNAENKREKGQSEAEVKRWETMARLIEKMPEARAIAEGSDEAKIALLKAATQMPRSRVLGIPVTLEEAAEVLAPERQTGAGKRADGVYEIVDVGTENPHGLTGKFKRIGDGLTVDAEINYSELTKDEVQTLALALTEKAPLDLKVNAWFVGDRVTRASILRIDRA